jgi:hypothetical protein
MVFLATILFHPIPSSDKRFGHADFGPINGKELLQHPKGADSSLAHGRGAHAACYSPELKSTEPCLHITHRNVLHHKCVDGTITNVFDTSSSMLSYHASSPLEQCEA